MGFSALDTLRLSALEKQALTTAIGDLEAEVYVFGSRTSLEPRGGDVDLILIPEAGSFSTYRLSQLVSVRFQMICEEKVDVVVLPREMTEAQASFFRTVPKVRVK